MIRTLMEYLGIEANTTSHSEKLVSGVGGFVGILLVLLISREFVGMQDAAMIVASMGASAVLLFAVPHGALAQPWAVLGGHTISAVVGVSCYLLIGHTLVAAALAVGIAIAVMYYLRCIHPPGGATALSAVVGSSTLHDLGYQFVVTPVLINALVIIAMAIIFNAAFPWRRYPVRLMRERKAVAPGDATRNDVDGNISHADLAYALREMNLTVDITEQDLTRIYSLAVRHAESGAMRPQDISLGKYYSNGVYGTCWSVRHVVDESGDSDPERDTIIYKVVAGSGRRKTGIATREEFSRWAAYEVFLNENSWQQVERSEAGNADVPS